MSTTDLGTVRDVTGEASKSSTARPRVASRRSPSRGAALAFGEPDRTSSDPGLFGPDSVSWLVHSDVVAGIGGVRALLLQGLLPDAVAAIVQHSGYKDDPWGRLLRTAEYIGVITYGTTAEAERAAAKVRGIHRRLGLDDPEWLMWVHAAFTDSLLTTARRAGLQLTDEQADTYVAEQQTAARLVGLDPNTAPSSVQTLNDYIDTVRPQLRADGVARDIMRFVFVPPMSRRASLLTPARPAWAGVAATSFALLPVWARRLYGGPLATLPVVGTTLAEAQADLAVRTLRRGLLVLPDGMRVGPHVAAARERLGLTELSL